LATKEGKQLGVYSNIGSSVCQKAQHDEEGRTLDTKLLIRPAQQKWKTLSQKLMLARGSSRIHRDGKACKEK
jgi:hypothetical protein